MRTIRRATHLTPAPRAGVAAMEPSPSAQPAGTRELWILLGCGAAALFPYVAFHGLFARLYWFGDDFDQVDLIDRLGFWRWMWLFYGENLVPLFKLVWGGCVLLLGGSYGALITLVWLNHALNVALLGRLMRTCGLPWAAVLFALAVFGLTPTTIETLAFSVEWSVVLSSTFMLLALNGAFRPPFRWASIAWIAASALSFVKGVLTGPVLACAVLWPEADGPRERLPRRLAHAALYALPSAVMGLLVATLAEGNHRHLAGHGAEAAIYAVWYFCLNPTFDLFSVSSWGWHTVAALGLVKVAVVGWALTRARGSQRALFVSLVAFDAATAVLLGIGRYNFGLPAAVSSRYQYASLIALLPLAGFCVARASECLACGRATRRGLLILLIGAIAALSCWRWSTEIAQWSSWRGTETRRILLADPAADPHSVPGYPGFPNQRAKELIAKYHLH